LLSYSQSSIIFIEAVVKDSHFQELKTKVLNELIRIHHEKYQEDINFWLYRTKDMGPVLELGCGHGRVTIPFLSSGRQIVGIDLDFEPLEYLVIASNEVVQLKPLLVQADMLCLPLNGMFGSVIIPCNTYSVFTTAERSILLVSIFQLLKSPGKFILSVPNPLLIQEYHHDLSREMSEQILDEEDIFPHPITGDPVQVRSHLNAGSDALCWEWVYDHLHPDGTVERYQKTAVHQLSSLEQYKKEILGTGFDISEYLGDFDGNPYEDDSPYLIMICSKN
jgi:SAM-dependent methyltransferase